MDVSCKWTGYQWWNTPFNVEITLNEILNAPNNASVGYFLDLDLIYPVHLHDDHRDSPLAPTKETVQDD